MIDARSVSVIVPTFNGAGRLMRLLEALRKQNTPGFEVVVVIDGSTDDTVTRVELARPWFERFLVASQENFGRSVVRNRGADLASGSLLIFFDDDMIPAPGCVDAHIEHHRRYPGSLLSGTTYEPEGTDASPFTRFRARARRRWDAPLRSHEGPLPPKMLHLTAANLSVEKDVFQRLGGFDERLVDGEDMVLLHRAHRAGIPVFYSSAAYAVHDDQASCAAVVRRLRQYHDARSRILHLHPDLRDVIGIPMSNQQFLKRTFYYLVAQPALVRWIDNRGGESWPPMVYDRFCASVVWGLGHVHRNRRI